MVILFRAGSNFIRVGNVGKNICVSGDFQRVEPPASVEAKPTSVRPSDVLLSIIADLGRACVVPDNIGLSVLPWCTHGIPSASIDGCFRFFNILILLEVIQR